MEWMTVDGTCCRWMEICMNSVGLWDDGMTYADQDQIYIILLTCAISYHSYYTIVILDVDYHIYWIFLLWFES
jgi:hypothetical protein